jgi:uncharacterized membrane protein
MATDVVPVVDEPAPATARQRAAGRFRLRYTLPGAWTAVVFACLSFTPSLLPRNGIVQGLVCGIVGAIGYGIGVVGASVWRAFADRDVRPPKAGSWRIFAIGAPLALLVAIGFGQWWQAQLRAMMGVEAGGPLTFAALPLLAAVVFVGLVAAGRGLRAAYRWAATLLSRWIGPRAAHAVGWMLVAAVTVAVASGVLANGFVAVADRTFSVRNGATPDGVVEPTLATRSGAPDSYVEWTSLGREGRAFIGRGPSAADISRYTGSPALEPVRAYAGLDSEDSTETRAELAVEDLQRAGGFDRAYLVVATTTGSGWVDPAAVDSIEYLTGGNSAVVAIQYSYLPSWISYLVDQKRAREAGRELFDAVYGRWASLPVDRRPKLLVFGESLGSFGGETAFSGEYDLYNRTSGAVFAGPPNFNTLHREFVLDRDVGSREAAPIFRNGRTVRFDDVPGPPVEPTVAPWEPPRVLYVQHPSDPIVWWSPNLVLSPPDWLDEAPGHDVLDAMTWLPFVTFCQVTADLPRATAVPPGFGHTYSAEYVDAWAVVLEPDGWDEDKAERLRRIIQPIP